MSATDVSKKAEVKRTQSNTMLPQASNLSAKVDSKDQSQEGKARITSVSVASKKQDNV